MGNNWTCLLLSSFENLTLIVYQESKCAQHWTNRSRDTALPSPESLQFSTNMQSHSDLWYIAHEVLEGLRVLWRFMRFNICKGLWDPWMTKVMYCNRKVSVLESTWWWERRLQMCADCIFFKCYRSELSSLQMNRCEIKEGFTPFFTWGEQYVFSITKLALFCFY